MSLCAPENLPEHVPGQILARSDGLGWNGVSLRTYGYRGQDVIVPATICDSESICQCFAIFYHDLASRYCGGRAEVPLVLEPFQVRNSL